MSAQANSAFRQMENIELADPDFHKPARRIDLLPGAEEFFDLLCIEQIKLSAELPSIQKTLFGWIVSGKYSGELNHRKLSCNIVAQKMECSLESLVERFWELDRTPDESKAVN